MATWSDVELLTNEDTNTVRFGIASTGDSDGVSGLYQVDTLVRITAADEVRSDPHLSSVSGPNWNICVADKTVILFDHCYQAVLLLLHFENAVDSIGVCLEGQFLVVCERNGNLHLIYVPHKRILLTRALVENASTGDKKTYRYLLIEEDKASPGMYHMFLLIKDGFFHITNLDLANIKTAIEKMDIGALKDLQSLIRVDFCSTKDYHDEWCGAAVIFTRGLEIHLMIGGHQGNVVSHWTMERRQGKMELVQFIGDSLIPGVRKMVVVADLMYVLDTEGVLSLWDVHFLVMVNCWPSLTIQDLELITECDSTSLVAQEMGSMKMITLEKTDHSQMSSLQIRRLPSMDVCYSLDVSSVSCLVQTTVNMDSIHFIEGTCENSDSGLEPVSSLVVRCLTEALPENRLSRLLHKHMFEEAEKFALTFDLDVELVYKVKLDFVLEQLASASVGGYGQDVWSELVEEATVNLKKITDEQYVVDYCLKAPWPTFDTAEKMLNYAATQYWSLPIQEALARLATFYSLHGLEKFNGIMWIEFLNSTDHLGDVLSHLRDGDVQGAQLLWLRHEGQIAVEFDESRLEAVLEAVPEDLPSQDLCPWFRTVFVPFVRRALPTGQKIVARWVEQRARNLELTEKVKEHNKQ